MTNEKFDMENGFLLLAAVCSLQRGKPAFPTCELGKLERPSEGPICYVQLAKLERFYRGNIGPYIGASLDLASERHFIGANRYLPRQSRLIFILVLVRIFSTSLIR
jgi:hypothetical protein